MDVGADNFRFTLEDQNGRKLPVQAFRPPCTTELHLDSLDRYMPNMLQTNVTQPFVNFPNNQNVVKLVGPNYLNSSLASTGCVIQTNRPMVYGYFSRVALTEFALRFRAPTVQTGYNNTFFLATGTAPGTIVANRAFTIPQGWYSINDYADAITIAMQASGPELASAICTVTDPAKLTLSFNTGDPAVYMAFQYGGGATGEQPQLSTGRAYRMAGITRPLLGYPPDINTGGQPNVAPTLWNNGLTGAPVNLLPTDYVDIVSSALSNYKDAKDGNSTVASPASVIGRVWLTENFTASASFSTAPIVPAFDGTYLGSSPITLVKKWLNPNWSQWSPNQTINTVDIKLLDMWGQQIMWTSSYATEWSATLTLTE